VGFGQEADVGSLYGSLLFANTMKMMGTMDEKLKNHLIFRLCHMNNTFYGGTTPVDSPKPPNDRARIAFVTSTESYIPLLKSAGEDAYISKCINVTAHPVSTLNPASYENLNLSNQEVIMVVHIGYPMLNAKISFLHQFCLPTFHPSTNEQRYWSFPFDIGGQQG